MEKLTRIKAGHSSDVDHRLQQGKILEEILKQDQNAPVPMEEQVMLLFGLQHGLLQGARPSEVASTVASYIAAVRLSRPEIVEKLVEGREMTEEIEQGLQDELDKFQNSAV